MLKPHGRTSIRKYRQSTTPWVEKYARGEIGAAKPEAAPGMTAVAQTTRSPAASESASMEAMGRRSRGLREIDRWSSASRRGKAAHSSLARRAAQNQAAAIQWRPRVQESRLSRQKTVISSVPRAKT